MEKFIKAAPADIPLIQNLAQASWDAAYREILSREQIDFMLGNMYSSETIRAQMENPHYHYFLVYFDEKPSGFVGFEHNYEAKTTKLHRIYFLPETHGKGMGKKAVDFVKKETEKFGNSTIILNVNKYNRAKDFYEKLGFSIYKEAVIEVGNGYIMDDFLMKFSF